MKVSAVLIDLNKSRNYLPGNFDPELFNDVPLVMYGFVGLNGGRTEIGRVVNQKLSDGVIRGEIELDLIATPPEVRENLSEIALSVDSVAKHSADSDLIAIKVNEIAIVEKKDGGSGCGHFIL